MKKAVLLALALFVTGCQKKIVHKHYETLVDPNSIQEVIDPCGEETEFDEVILKLASGEFLAYFALNGDAKKARLVLLDEGVNYQTTDGTSCAFIITDGELIEL